MPASQRVNKAQPLLDAIGALPDPQTGLLLLRHCAGFSKLVYTLRVTPAALLGSSFKAFDDAVKHTLETCCTGPLTAQAWQQASLSTAKGGLGLRHMQLYGPAGYAASLLATNDLCALLDPAYTNMSNEALQVVNQNLPQAKQFPVPAPHTLRQQQLSQALDQALLAQLVAPAPGREAFRANLQLLQQPGAGAWLHAPPSEALGLHVAPPLFRLMLRMRLRLPIADADTPCPKCDGVNDTFGDHARVCGCGGDRTKRHHRLRGVLAARTKAAGLHTEIEKPGLLPPRLDAAEGPEDSPSHNGRRPADVWVGSWGVHGPAAFDLAVTSGLRQQVFPNTLQSGEHAVTEYEVRKCRHQDTERTCSAEGLQFIPLVAEACSGGWGPCAVRVWKTLAIALAARSHESVAVETERLLQSLGITLQRENARAALRRLHA